MTGDSLKLVIKDIGNQGKEFTVSRGRASSWGTSVHLAVVALATFLASNLPVGVTMRWKLDKIRTFNSLSCVALLEIGPFTRRHLVRHCRLGLAFCNGGRLWSVGRDFTH